MPDPTPIYPAYLTIEECSQIIAIWEKTGALGSVVRKIRAATAAKKTR
jgi:hypothetical protein